MKVLIVGAGNIGSQIAKYLLTLSSEYEVIIADRSYELLQNLSSTLSAKYLEKFKVLHKSVTELDKKFPDVDIIVNALPHTENIKLIDIAVKHQVHYFDLSEDVNSTKYIKTLSTQNSNLAFMPQCGLAPGFINIVANDLSKKFDEIYDVHMRVGALPVSSDNAFKYNFTWSVDGLINEYINDGFAIENRETVAVKGLEGLEKITLNGIEYEAFNTSGGAGSLINSMSGKVRNVNYKTLRYPGHSSLVKVLLDDLELRNDRVLLKQILTNAIPFTQNDTVIVYASVTGYKDGKFTKEDNFQQVYYKDGVTAIQQTTAAGLCVAIDLFRTGKLSQTGFLKQEDITLSDFLNSTFNICYI